MSSPSRPPRVLVVGGGYVGLYASLRLLRRLRRDEATVTVVDPRSYMTYQPFLPEAGAGSIQPRHTVVPLRRTLPGAEVLSGWVTAVDHDRRAAVVQPLEGASYEVGYDVLVVAPGAVARTLPIPGLAEFGSGFKNVEEAIALRNRVLESLDVAESTRDPEVRARCTTFVFVGGGYAGVEAMAEAEDMARYATRLYRTLAPEDLRFVLVEAAPRILSEIDEGVAEYATRQLRERGIDVRLSTRLESCTDGHVVLDDGTELDAAVLVWTAGVRPNPLLAATGLPLDDGGRLLCGADLAVTGVPGVFSAGDCAAVPDLTRPGRLCAPTAQHAVRQAKVLGDNVVAHLRGEPLRDYSHRNAGAVASLGLYKGVADIYGVKLRGFPAWFLHRTYHMSRVPTLQRKVSVVADWTIGFFFQRDVTSLWTTRQPGAEFARAARGQAPGPLAEPRGGGATGAPVDGGAGDGAGAAEGARAGA